MTMQAARKGGLFYLHYAVFLSDTGVVVITGFPGNCTEKSN